MLPFLDSYVDSGLSVITMTDSRNGNRLNAPRLEDLSRSFDSALEAQDVRAVLLRSDGSCFCQGMDIESLVEKEKDRKAQEHGVSLYSDLLVKLHRSLKPVVALVRGEVKGGGLGLAVACDVVIASERSSFELPEVKLGLIPANVLPFLLLFRVSSQTAKYMTLTGKRLDADQALSLNLVDEVYPEEELEKKLRALFKSLFRTDPKALAAAKKFIQKLASADLEDACREARAELLRLMSDTRTIQGVKSMKNGDLPEWFSKFRPTKSLIE